MQPPTKSFHRNLTSLAARSTRSSLRGGTTLWPPFASQPPFGRGIDRTYATDTPILPSARAFLKLDHVSASPRANFPPAPGSLVNAPSLLRAK